jgi:hypothetical protein
MIPSVIIRTEERRSVKLGGKWFYHSTKTRLLFVTTDRVSFEGDTFIKVMLDCNLPVYIRNEEIKEIQFV